MNENTTAKITPLDIEAIIVNEYYFTAMDGAWGRRMSDRLTQLGEMSSDIDERIDANQSKSMKELMDQPLPPREHVPRKELNEITICVMILANGFKVVGVNEGPVSPKNFDADTGKRLARQKAIDKIWALEGYLLKERMNKSDT